MTVFENMAFGLKLRKFSGKEIDKRVNEAAEILGLEELLHRKPKELSGGQRQRVAVGRAIVRKPKVFLFDEPLSNLDAKLRVQMRLEISRLHKKLGTTMIYVTHDQTEAMTMGNRICVLKDGVLQQVDTPMNLYRSPVNRFVAGFIGSPAMNFFSGKLAKDTSGKLVFKTGNFGFQIPEKIAEAMAKYGEQKLILGIRPEYILPEEGTDKPLSFSCEIDVVEPVGNETFFYFSDGGNTYCIRNSALAEEIKPGDRKTFRLDEANVCFFSPDSEELIFKL
jgi:multiple sugar transport system ATP-binding protein